MPKNKNVFLSAIHQNAGKTTIALGLHRLLLEEHQLKCGFLKPVGQEYVTVNRQHIDKDTYLIAEVYHYRKENLKTMSPVTLGRGFTQEYIFHPHKEKLRREIVNSYSKVSKGKDIVIVEGTGHAGVGSVIDFSNADVAALLGSKVIIVSEGGIGKSIDEVMLNKALFDLKNVEILGVIVNKVLPEKFNKIKKAVKQGLKNKGLRLLGVIPVEPLLSAPMIGQIAKRLKFKLLCGRGDLSQRVSNTIVAAMQPHNMVSFLAEGTLVITSGDRADNILVAVTMRLFSKKKRVRLAGIILTGGMIPDERIINILKKSGMPVLLAEEDTYTVAGKVEHLTCNIQKIDKDKIETATRLVREYVDVKAVLKNL